LVVLDTKTALKGKFLRGQGELCRFSGRTHPDRVKIYRKFFLSFFLLFFDKLGKNCGKRPNFLAFKREKEAKREKKLVLSEF
jgi:hypothetical protein